ncbi:MAG: hypothetical protein IK990_11110 [Ruminiclostridium sp.]|nr:hypothetical protein [Ruminiclostridium sp.]
MRKSIRLTAAALAAVTALSCASVTAFADKLKTVDGVTYRYSDSGEKIGKYTGWAKNSKGRLYFKNGSKLKNKWLKTTSGKYYYAGKDGYMRTGWAMVRRNGNGLYSYFNEKGVWDGKTYWQGYRVRDLATLAKDIDFFAGDTFYWNLNNHDEREMREFDDIYIVREILMQDLNTPLSWAEFNDDEIDPPDDVWRDGTSIVIRSSVTKNLDLEFTKDDEGHSYVYNPWYGFGMRLSDDDAYDKIAETVGADIDGVFEDDDDAFDEPEPLEQQEIKTMFNDFIKYKSGKAGWNGVTADDLTLVAYYGTYKNGEVVIIYGKDREFTDDYWEYDIGGYTVSVSSGSFELLLHNNGTFIDIREAYKQGLLTRSDIEMIAYFNSH